MEFKDVKLEQIRYIMPYTKMAIPINKGCYRYLFNANVNGILYDNLFNKFNEIYNDSRISSTILKNLCLYFYPTKHGWKIGIYPVSILNAILSICGIDQKTRVFYDLSRGDDYNTIKDRFLRCFEYNKENTDNAYVKNLLDKTINGIDQILSFDSVSLDNDINNAMIPKNVLLFLAYYSLKQLVATNDKQYSSLPYIYYNSYSKSSTYYWPNKIYCGAEVIWLDSFNRLYETTLRENPDLLFGNKEIVSSGNLVTNTDNNDIDVYQSKSYVNLVDSKRVRDYRVKDYEVLGRKLKLYSDDRIKYVISGEQIFNNYVGFVCDNDNIIFDKLYEDSDYMLPATDCAVYVMPSDNIELIRRSRTDLMNMIKNKTVPNLRRFYHSKGFEDKILKVMEEESCSTKTFEEMLEEKKLVLKISI